jgi:hypothetical protein
MERIAEAVGEARLPMSGLYMGQSLDPGHRRQNNCRSRRRLIALPKTAASQPYQEFAKVCTVAISIFRYQHRARLLNLGSTDKV